MNDIPITRRLEFANQMVDTLREANARLADQDEVEIEANSLRLKFSARQLQAELKWWVSQVERHLAAMA